MVEVDLAALLTNMTSFIYTGGGGGVACMLSVRLYVDSGTVKR